MKNAVSENSLVVLNYLKEHKGENLTSASIADALGKPVKTVDGIVTAGLSRKGLAERIPAQILVKAEDGTERYKDVKFVRATEAGLAYDHKAAVAADIEAATKAE